ncbi:Ig-like domain-containing protein [Pseudodesulfovibrio piezophilus]|uniref:RapA2 cadherin-like domain-containing protein n=1 Tax=Pseudodesulfovibrio piezophilus (strain DSM 21447 / JCM 15486 / C1TLV30) TaxID=1322246 RepID=M1WM30_PSEP2|nr:Ig-like domain-containing protein [Pseudodesulfovibrio piezophilus]CCH48890.1 protein of unknown function [Pseudodesulfovibrio piezophilus C1TLV30]
MADDNVNDIPIPDGDEESLREQQDEQAAEGARQASEDAEKLRAEEFPQQGLLTGDDEQPFGSRKDDESLLSEGEGAAADTAPGTDPIAVNRVETPESQAAPAPEADAVQPGDAAAPPEAQAAPGGATQAAPSSSSSVLRNEGTDPDVSLAAPDGETEESAPEAPPADVIVTEGEDPIITTAQAPALNVELAQVNEDGTVPLIIEATLQDTDQGGETLSILISGLPEGAVLSAGTDLGDGVWELTAEDLDGLTLSPPPDSNVDFTLSVTATSTGSDGSTASVEQDLPVDVIGVADEADFTASLGEATEDQNMPFDISGSLTDTDGSETLTYVVSDIPDGFSLTAGTDNGDGTWTLTSDEASGLELVPPADFSGDVDLTVTAITTESDGSTASSTSSVSGSFTPVADAPDVTVSDATGSEDGSIALDISAALTDTDGSETISVVVSNIPDGSTLSSGTDNGDGTWTLTAEELTDLTITPPEHFSGSLNLTVAATSTDANGDTATTSAPLRVDVAAVVDAPTLSTSAAVGSEDVPVQLDIASSLVDTDGSETLSLNLSGIPDGISLSAGTDNGDGSWTLTSPQLSGLTMTMPRDYKGNFDITVEATSTESVGGETAVVTAVVPVTVNAVADTPALTVIPAVSSEDTSMALTIETSVTDTSGTESITDVVVSGLPAGATLSAGTDNGDGSWSLAPADLEGLILSPPADSNVDFTLTVTSTAREPNGSTAQSVAMLPVSITGVADTPTVTTIDAEGNEDSWIQVQAGGALTDTDSSESLSFSITDLPTGASLNVGTQNPDGSWDVSSEDIGNLYVRPPSNYSGTFDITVTSLATENDGDIATASEPVSVTVNAVADAARSRARDVSGDEDNDVPLDLSASVRDDSEVIESVVITGVPEGFSIVGGTDLGGDWSVPAESLDSLSIRAPQDYSGTVNLGFDVTTLEPENGSTRTTSRSFDVTFEAVADAPIITANNVTTLEDTPVQLDLLAQLTDTDLSETLEVTVSGVPAGASLSSGTDNGDGSWTIDPADLGTVTLTPPQHFSGEIALEFTATSTESSNNDTVSRTAGFTVGVTGVADIPEITVVDVQGTEDTEIALTVRAELEDADGSESLYVEFSGVPEGATFSAGTMLDNGNWLIPSGDLDSLTMTPPPDSNVDFTLTARSLAIEADGDRVYSVPQDINVSLQGDPDVPIVTMEGARGDEDTSISLNFTAESTDTDGSETISYVVSNIPAGASLSAGTFIGNGRWAVSAEDMPTLSVTPPSDYSGTFDLSVTVVVQEDDGRQSQEEYSVPVTVDPVVDQTDRGSVGGSASYGTAGGLEDTAIALNVDPGLTDADGSETVLWVDVSGLPVGATLSAGTEDPDNPGVFRILPSEFAGLTVTPPENSDVDFDLTVQATIQESGGATVVSEGQLHVEVHAVADAPLLETTSLLGLVNLGAEASLTDTDGSESLSFILSGFLGLNVAPSAGINLGNGSYLLTEDQLDGLSLSSDTLALGTTLLATLHAVSTEAENGDTAVTSESVLLQVSASIDLGGDLLGGGLPDPGTIIDGSIIGTPMTLEVNQPTGSEDSPFAVDISADFGTGGSQYGVIISNLPEGARPNTGYYDPVNDQWVISGDDPSLLENLEITPPADFAGALDFTVSIAKTGEDGLTQQTSTVVTATLDPVVDSPQISLGNPEGTEDTPFLLDLNVNVTDGSEQITSVVISNLPSGATILGATDLGDGRFEVGPDQLDQVQFSPPENAHGDFSFTVDAVVEESDGTQSSFSSDLGVSIQAVADPASISVTDASGLEDTAIPLNIDVDLVDTDGSETTSLTLSGVPTDSLFSAGINNGDGSWTFTPGQLDGLTFTPPPNASGDFELTLSVYTLEESTGEVAVSTQAVTVSVEGEADDVPVDSIGTSGDEDTAIPIELSYSSIDTDGSETVTAVLTGIPAGASLSAGVVQGDGSWLVQGEDLPDLTITPPLDFSGSIDIHAEIVVTEADGDSVSTGTDFSVEVIPVADNPNLSPQSVVGDEDTAIPLDLQASVSDAGEILEVSVSDLPAGATLSAGTKNSDGSWTLSASDLPGLTLLPDQNQSGDYTLSVTATSTEPETGETAQTSATFDVSITPVADAPTLIVDAATGDEDTTIPLDIEASLTDISEVLSVTLSQLPEGASLSAGINNPDGSWTLAPEDLPGLTLTPADNQSGDYTITVTATSQDGASQAETISDLSLSITPVADTPNLIVAPAVGLEDTAISLDIQAALLDTSEVLEVTIEGVPTDATLSAGTQNPDGSWSLLAADLDGLRLFPAEDQSGDYTLTVTATALDGAAEAEVVVDLPLSILPVADTPNLIVAPAVGLEDTAISLDIQAALLDTSEVLEVTIEGVPTDATLSAGTQNPDGSWSLLAADLDGLRLFPAEDQSGDYTLTVTATALDGAAEAEVVVDLPLSILPVADTPNLVVLPAVGLEDTAISLDIQTSLLDTSELLEITIEGVPTDATLSAGTQNPDGSWSLLAADLDGLTLTPPPDSAEDFDLTVTATALDGSSEASTTVTLNVDVIGDPDVPTFSVLDVLGDQDQPIALSIDAQTDLPGELLTVTISGVPDGGSLTAGQDNGGGSWTLSSDEVPGLSLNPPEGFTGLLDLTVEATVEQDGSSITLTENVSVEVLSVDLGLSTEAQLYTDILGLGTQTNDGSDATLAQALDHTLNGQDMIADSLDNSLLEEPVTNDGDLGAADNTELLDPIIEQIMPPEE